MVIKNALRLAWLIFPLVFLGCRDRHITGNTKVSQLAPGTYFLAPKGDYASIDTKPLAVMEKLNKTTAHESDSLIQQIEQHSENYPPPVFFSLANLLYRQGNGDDAIFWYNAGKLRGDFDADRCADISAKDAVQVMVMSMPIALRKSQFNDLDKLQTIIEKVIKWDKDTPYDYDYRWINLHGMDAMGSSLGDASGKPMTVPRETWDNLALKNRDQYQKGLDDVLAKKRAAAAGH